MGSASSLQSKPGNSSGPVLKNQKIEQPRIEAVDIEGNNDEEEATEVKSNIAIGTITDNADITGEEVIINDEEISKDDAAEQEEFERQ